jgi:hypothetical protein
MSGDDLAKALTSGGEAWLVFSVAAILPITLWDGPGRKVLVASPMPANSGFLASL